MISRRTFIGGCVAAGAGAALPVVKAGMLPEPAVGDLVFLENGSHFTVSITNRLVNFTKVAVSQNNLAPWTPDRRIFIYFGNQ